MRFSLIRNFTPHEVVVYDEQGEKILERFPSEGSIRVRETILTTFKVDNIPICLKKYDGIEDVPSWPEPIICIVSMPTLLMLSAEDRKNFVAPDTGPDSVVRNDAGQIVGVRRFMKL